MNNTREKPSIGIILTQKQQIRVWLEPSFIAEISKELSVYFYIDSDFKSECAEYDYKGIFVHINKVPSLDKKLIENLMIKHKKWPTFARRVNTLEEILRNDLVKTRFRKNPKTYIRFAGRLVSFKIRQTIGPALRFSNWIIQARLKRDYPKLPNHSLYVLVSNTNDITNEKFEYALRKKLTPWIQVAENWDNLSSKLCPSKSSDRLLVWGEQTKNHARDIHEFSEDRISVVGSPRFPNLAETKLIISATKDTNPTLTVFYAGYGGEHENYDWINDIKQALQKSRFKNQNSLTFRPHPNSIRQFGVEYFESWEKNIKIDMPTRGSNGKSDWPAIEANMYNKLVNADIVIGTPSTFLLETLLFERYVILDYRDNLNILNSPKRNFSNLTHLEEIHTDLNFHRFETVDQLTELIDNYKKDGSTKPTPYDYFVHNETVSYGSRLVREIHKVLSLTFKPKNNCTIVDLDSKAGN